MAETTVENQVCNACGADVRPGALFCYHCGGAVASEIAVVKTDKNEAIDELQPPKSGGRENENGLNLKPERTETKQKDTVSSFKGATEKPLAEPSPQKDVKLKSAATMRGKSKLVQPQKIEVIWEERESTPNVWFILAALILTVAAATILFIAVRLK